jgi:hypothetical protein
MEFDATALSREVHAILAIVITILVLQLVPIRCCTVKCKTKEAEQTLPSHSYKAPQSIVVRN